MSKALIAFTALLGLFSFPSLAAPDDGSSCRQKAENNETASPRFIGASTCSEVGSVFTGNDHCEVKATPQSTCIQDQFGVWVGSPYYFTGCLAGGGSCGGTPDPDPEDPDPEDPDPEDPDPEDPDPEEPEEPVVVAPPPLELPTWNEEIPLERGPESFYVAAGNSLIAIESRLNNITSYLTQDSNMLRNAITSRYDSVAAEVRSQAQFTRGSLSNSIRITDSKVQNVQSTQNAILSEITALRNSLPDGSGGTPSPDDGVLEAIQDVKNQVVSVQGQLDDPLTKEAKHAELLQAAFSNDSNIQDIKDTTNEIRNRTNTINSTTNQTKSSVDQLRSSVSNIASELSNLKNNMLDTSDLQQISFDIFTASGEIQNSMGNNFGQIMTGIYGTHGEQMSTMSEIKSLIENGGGSGEPSGGDTGTHERLDTTNYELSELRKLLDSRTTTGNNSLAGIASLIQDGNAIAQAQGQQLTQIAGSLDGVSQSISGLGESIEGLKEGFEGVAMSEGDFRPEEGVLSALGLTGEESIADLTDDPVYLDDYRHQYDTFLTGSCPENIPVQFSLLGKSYSFNLFYKPVCDFMEIAGTILNFAVWFGVPFIVFGSRRVS